jgi:hypothetical protein
VATDGFLLDLEMIEKFLGLARVFAGDAVDGAENFKRAQRDVAEVADRSGDEVKTRRQIRSRIRPWGSIFLARHSSL